MSSNKPIKFELNDIKKAVIRKFPLVTDAFTNVNFREAPINTAAQIIIKAPSAL